MSEFWQADCVISWAPKSGDSIIHLKSALRDPQLYPFDIHVSFSHDNGSGDGAIRVSLDPAKTNRSHLLFGDQAEVETAKRKRILLDDRLSNSLIRQLTDVLARALLCGFPSPGSAFHAILLQEHAEYSPPRKTDLPPGLRNPLDQDGSTSAKGIQTDLGPALTLESCLRRWRNWLDEMLPGMPLADKKDLRHILKSLDCWDKQQLDRVLPRPLIKEVEQRRGILATELTQLEHDIPVNELGSTGLVIVTPTSFTWEEVSIHWLSFQKIQLKVGASTEVCHARRLNLLDSRGKKRLRLPGMMLVFLAFKPSLTALDVSKMASSRTAERGLGNQRIADNAKRAVSELRRILKTAFGLSSDPFYKKTPAEGWSPRFTVTADRNLPVINYDSDHEPSQ